MREADAMPSYRAPVEDTLFLLNDVLAIHRYDNLPGFADASADLAQAVLSEGGRLAGGSVRAAEPARRPGGLHPPGGWQRRDAEGLQGGLRRLRRRRLDGPVDPRGVRRPGPAARAQHGDAGIRLRRQPRPQHVSWPDAGGDRRAARPRLARAEGDLPAQDG
ncbi:protein of unknown function [Methylorubrum extorquens]|uniref:Uncharacterized protein n=1 Tax=Methylorubrum extorquens TaxID=408 RepID=A0A2N9AP19_METEX|nr:protein of unknown function [Methylorubrum extorquens]